MEYLLSAGHRLGAETWPSPGQAATPALCWVTRDRWQALEWKSRTLQSEALGSFALWLRVTSLLRAALSLTIPLRSPAQKLKSELTAVTCTPACPLGSKWDFTPLSLHA